MKTYLKRKKSLIVEHDFFGENGCILANARTSS